MQKAAHWLFQTLQLWYEDFSIQDEVEDNFPETQKEVQYTVSYSEKAAVLRILDVYPGSWFYPFIKKFINFWDMAGSR
jgi:hypothetical protein